MQPVYPGGALTSVLRGSAVPYGFTLTVLAAHSVLAHRHGQPDVYDIGLFVAGGLLGFGALGLLAWARGRPPLELDEARTIGVGMANVFAIGAAFGGVALVSLVGGRVAWVLGAFAAIVLYLAIAGLEFSIADRAARRR